jgi:hypothetical protein
MAFSKVSLCQRRMVALVDSRGLEVIAGGIIAGDKDADGMDASGAAVPTRSTSVVNAHYTQPLCSVAKYFAANTNSIAEDAYRYPCFLLPGVGVEQR